MSERRRTRDEFVSAPRRNVPRRRARVEEERFGRIASIGSHRRSREGCTSSVVPFRTKRCRSFPSPSRTRRRRIRHRSLEETNRKEAFRKGKSERGTSPIKTVDPIGSNLLSWFRWNVGIPVEPPGVGEDSSHRDVGPCSLCSTSRALFHVIRENGGRRGSWTIPPFGQSWPILLILIALMLRSVSSVQVEKESRGSGIDTRLFPSCILDVMDGRNQARTHMEIQDGSTFEDQDRSFIPFYPIVSNRDPYHS